MDVWVFYDYSVFKPGCQFIIFSASWLHKPNPGEFNFTMNTATAFLKVQSVSSASEKSEPPPSDKLFIKGWRG